ncbi:unnamed protein product [Peronospora belbahrii]|uniref:BAG domain-containing protein n=1 Tax=Peronospora belbahrii TaxID=622444 RepID=A0ABN8D4Q1_9STRA|nr:unnamed protein product [Peronospora belbahrii]
MTRSPSPKRLCTGDNKRDENGLEREKELEREKRKEIVENVQKIEEELEQLSIEKVEEVLAVETKYIVKTRDVYVKRNELLSEIPHFWNQVFLRHPVVGNYLNMNDGEELMEYLQTFVVFVGKNGSFKIKLIFHENPYFFPTMLWKQFDLSKKDVKVSASKITWTERAYMRKATDNFFFQWIVSTEGDQGLAEIIKEELWKNPLEYFVTDDEDEDSCDKDESDEDESDEVEDKDIEEQEEEDDADADAEGKRNKE